MRNVLLRASASALVIGLLGGCAAAPHPQRSAVASLQTPSSTQSPNTLSPSTQAASPAAVSTWDATDATITVGTGKHALDVFVDPLCPYCAEFDQAQESTIKDAVSGGNIRLVVHPLVFLDRASEGTAYSTRAASVLVATARQRPDAVLDVMNDLFEHQPTEDTPGMSNASLLKLAKRHGVDAKSALSDTSLKQTLRRATTKAFSGDDAITGTPTARLDGNDISEGLYSSDFGSALSTVLN